MREHVVLFDIHPAILPKANNHTWTAARSFEWNKVHKGQSFPCSRALLLFDWQSIREVRSFACRNASALFANRLCVLIVTRAAVEASTRSLTRNAALLWPAKQHAKANTQRCHSHTGHAYSPATGAHQQDRPTIGPSKAQAAHS